jgi:hypothetical protein
MINNFLAIDYNRLSSSRTLTCHSAAVSSRNVRIGPVFKNNIPYYITTCIYLKNNNFKKILLVAQKLINKQTKLETIIQITLLIERKQLL